jgi:hypothetical protein
VVILGGPSLLVQQFDFARLSESGVVTFAETKALTPALLAAGLLPDYYLMPFPEKAKDNALQHFVYRSILARVRIDRLLRPEYRGAAAQVRDRFDEYFEAWRPHRGPHKQFRWRPDVYLPESPYSLLERVPRTRILANGRLLNEYFPTSRFADRTFTFEQAADQSAFDVQRYFSPEERDGEVFLRGGGAFLNSAAIALYPLLHYLGFREAAFLGMDMSMLGTLEYSAPFAFRSMAHFWWFFHRSRHVFNASYRRNGWLFRRPQSEFDDLRRLWRDSPVAFTRVYAPWRHATPVDGIPTMTPRALLELIAPPRAPETPA